MKHRNKIHRNPGGRHALMMLGYAAGGAVIGAGVGYAILREVFTNHVLEICTGALRQTNPAASSRQHRAKIRSLL